MKNSVKSTLMGLFAVAALSSCTMGDKGSSKVPDSVKIDTNQKAAQPPQKSSDTTLIDSLQTDTVAKGATKK